MNNTMSNIRSVLIHTCMSNIQKEISQLEQWLINLSDNNLSNVPNSMPSNQYDISQLCHVTDKLSEQLNVQQLTLTNIIERIDALEGYRTLERDVFINNNQNTHHTDPWIDNNCEPLQNEVICSDSISEPLYTIYKKEVSEISSVTTPSIIPNIPEDSSIPPEIDTDNDDVHIETNIKINKETVEEVKETVEEVKETVEEVKETVKEVKETVKEVKETVKEEEKEEGIELEEIEYNNIRYYKDNEKFIYSINNENEPSENPIGYWKDKTQTIAFYKLLR